MTPERVNRRQRQGRGSMSNSWVDRDNNTPIFLRNIHPLNVPRKDDNLIPQSLNPAYKCPDAQPTAGKSNALIAKQMKGDEGRTATPWHELQKKNLGWTERDRLGRLIRSPESSRFLLCLFPCGRSPSLSALTSIKLKLCALPWGPPLTAYSRSSFLRLRRSLISDTADRRSSLLIGTPDL